MPAPGRPPRASGRELLGMIATLLADIPLMVTAPLYRRRHVRWGATDAEVAAAMPGDELLPRARFRCTRAITIDAGPAAVWPWLAQMGCLRGGFYAADLVDNLARPSARTILPQFHDVRVGDRVPLLPTEPTETTAFLVRACAAPTLLVWTLPGMTWAWTLDELPGGRTRLVTRLRADYDLRRPVVAAFTAVALEFGDFAMMRRMLLGIRERAGA